MAKAEKANEKQRYKLKKFLKELEGRRGRGTELVSVYIPEGYDLNKITTHVAEEQGTATNIKSKQTRDNVIGALEKIIQHLKLYPKTPPNGLAVFAGNVSENDGKTDFQVWSIEPPLPLNQRLYRCDKEFVLEPLQDMLQDKEFFGLVAMDRREATIALLKGKSIIPLSSTESMVPGKFRAGGQSAARFARNRELAAKEFYNKIAGMMKDQFFEMEGLQGILVGGPGPTKYEFVDGNFLTQSLKDKIITIQDLSYTDEFGLQELLEKSENVLSDEAVVGEKRLITKFFNLLSKTPGMASYGKDDCMRLIKMGAVDTMIISETIDEETIEEFIKQSDLMGTNVEIVSKETREGTQIRDMGGFVAILRYDVGENN
ncbi:peptide chain release factor aRF-1 [Candidatus Woesearchaeota archaeon]|nr:peptide chain release factor aRF-1 [Candidatus Woesearchaeota archaeon]MCF7901531.1 peptide chain release factor aRF-1 [Candidatus Woesearchaeota archaeon]MCF8013875.1 peptide chain release factor aRF-1 [Candidatus Woesearchaeota archaeon]